MAATVGVPFTSGGRVSGASGSGSGFLTRSDGRNLVDGVRLRAPDAMGGLGRERSLTVSKRAGTGAGAFQQESAS